MDRSNRRTHVNSSILLALLTLLALAALLAPAIPAAASAGGTVVGWGSNGVGETNVRDGLT